MKNLGNSGPEAESIWFTQELWALDEDEKFVSHARVNLRTRGSLEDGQWDSFEARLKARCRTIDSQNNIQADQSWLFLGKVWHDGELTILVDTKIVHAH